MGNRKLLSALGLCRKAGRLAMGFDAAAEVIGKGRAPLLVLASDLSPKSAKEIIRLAEMRNIDILRAPATMDEIMYSVGKRAGILAVTDGGLSKSVQSALAACQEEENSL